MNKSSALGFTAGVILALATPILASPPTITREATGDRLEKLTNMELKAVDAKLWSKLTDWNQGEALTPDNTKGRVVLVCTFAHWYQTSMRGIALAQKLSKQYKDKDLIVVGVHHPDGYEGIASSKAVKKLTFRYALDKNGAFRKALLVDQDPDFYVIDRAGRLRYADIESASVSQAVSSLVSESFEQADTLPDRLKADAQARKLQSRRTGDLAESIDMTKLPAVSFEMPDSDVFEVADWPTREDDSQRRSSRNEDTIGQSLAIPDTGWVPKMPSRAGKATLVYFWNPKPEFAWTISRINEMDIIQRRYMRDLVVVGVAVPSITNDRNRGRFDDVDPEKEMREFMQLMATFLKSRIPGHSIFIDQPGAIFDAAFGDNNRRSSNRRQGKPTGLVALLSSDGVIRWIGDPSEPSYKGSLDQILRIDPGILARRAAESEYLKGRG